MIEFSDLSIGYKRRRSQAKTVAEGLSAVIPAGRLACLLGRNGAGKSTLLRTLAGFQPSLAGQVSVCGQPLGSLSAKKRAQLIGVVLTSRPDDVRLTVSEVVALGRSPYTNFWGRLADNDRQAVENAMQQVGIGELADRAFSTLSDGERQKTMIARSLAQQTPVIILDEPTAWLDYPSRVETFELLARLAHTAGRTILLSTHEPTLALRHADLLLLLADGRLQVAEASRVAEAVDPTTLKPRPEAAGSASLEPFLSAFI